MGGKKISSLKLKGVEIEEFEGYYNGILTALLNNNEIIGIRCP